MSKRTPVACSIEACDRPVRARTWCKRHYRWWELRGDPNAAPERAYAERYECLTRDDAGRKECRTCGQWLHTGDFYGNKQTGDLLAPDCRACHRLKDVHRKYGITPDEFTRMLSSQGNACLVCQIPFDVFARRPHVDHDHACCPGERCCGECVRGILCSNCNTGLGLFKDDPDLLRAALAYLAA